MRDERRVIHSDHEIPGGTPVFVGTRVPVQTLPDYFEGGHPLAEFLDDFPSVTSHHLRDIVRRCPVRGLVLGIQDGQWSPPMGGEAAGSGASHPGHLAHLPLD